MIAQIQHHQELARLFVLHLHDGQVTLAGVNFTLTPETISQAIGIPNVGEGWNKRQQVERVHYEPYIRPSYVRQLNKVFPFWFLKESYAPLMRLIIRYFSCEGHFSRLSTYHIRLLMHFTRVKMMNIPYFMCRNIERMTTLVQKKTLEQQYNNIYHCALIKIIVVHQLGLQGITWEDFISCEFFIASAAHQEVLHDVGEPSHQYGG